MQNIESKRLDEIRAGAARGEAAAILDLKRVELAEEYIASEPTGGVWLRARGRDLVLRDGAGPAAFDKPSKRVTSRNPRFFKHRDAAEFEGNREIAVVGWALPGEKAPGEAKPKHPAGWCDVVLEEFRPPPDPTPPRSAAEVEIARQRDEARAELDAVRRRNAELEAENGKLGDLIVANDASANDAISEIAELRAQLQEQAARTKAADAAAAEAKQALAAAKRTAKAPEAEAEATEKKK